MSNEALKYYTQCARNDALRMTLLEKLVMRRLADRHSMIAERLAVSARALGWLDGIRKSNVQRALISLERKGLVIVIRTKAKRKPNEYLFSAEFDRAGSGEQWAAGAKVFRQINEAREANKPGKNSDILRPHGEVTETPENEPGPEILRPHGEVYLRPHSEVTTIKRIVEAPENTGSEPIAKPPENPAQNSAALDDDAWRAEAMPSTADLEEANAAIKAAMNGKVERPD